ncbi:glycosyltransferase [Brunnivagina elsteri]|uniref:Glycosyl transferase n=1 Tax=Brunnivagina elsteri CCALA 953 TaxID=987040 RepID=A0A2A2TER0_9CYAN|nr:glycosyltransferase [Calothrix elsteri]PAX52222.1 glycosyl transferase [Calothrix elsteri CCALA 953]
MSSIGIVVIGRNEGNRLKTCLLSLIKEENTIIYVDSGSTDGSVEFANSLGVFVIELDLSIPFTAARARNTGFAYLLQQKPDIEFVQFVDGDSQIVEGWLTRATVEMLIQPDVVVVFGYLRELFPKASIFNRVCNVEWYASPGEAKYCGGIAMMRVSALKQVGGFNPALIAGEEPELCVRLRQAGGKILAIDAEMAQHDAAMTSFSQWCKRSIRNGYAYAEGAWSHNHWARESRRIWFWGLFLPLLTIASFFPTKGLSILLFVIANTYLFYRVYSITLLKGFEQKDSIIYGLFCTIDKYPMLYGQIQFHTLRLFKRSQPIMEYKNIMTEVKS